MKKFYRKKSFWIAIASAIGILAAALGGPPAVGLIAKILPALVAVLPLSDDDSSDEFDLSDESDTSDPSDDSAAQSALRPNPVEWLPGSPNNDALLRVARRQLAGMGKPPINANEREREKGKSISVHSRSLAVDIPGGGR